MGTIHQIVMLVILLAYGLLVIELVFLHVPSVASVYQLIWRNQSIVNYSDEKLLSGRLYAVLHWPLVKKIVLLALPTGISIITGVLPLYYIFSLHKYADWPDYNNLTQTQNIFGIILITGGRYFTLYATFKIRKGNLQKGKSFALKTDGVFGISRNPLLIGMYIMYAGMLIVFPTTVFAAGLLVYVLNMHFRILLEEEFLTFHFGKPFLEYKKNVKRYL